MWVVLSKYHSWLSFNLSNQYPQHIIHHRIKDPKTHCIPDVDKSSAWNIPSVGCVLVLSTSSRSNWLQGYLLCAAYAVIAVLQPSQLRLRLTSRCVRIHSNPLQICLDIWSLWLLRPFAILRCVWVFSHLNSLPFDIPGSTNRIAAFALRFRFWYVPNSTGGQTIWAREWRIERSNTQSARCDQLLDCLLVANVSPVPL